MSDVVVVIGGSGFVGTRLCELLRDERLPFLIVDKRASETFPDRCVVADVRDEEALARVLPPNAVWIHLAAEHRDDVTPKSLYYDVNVEGTRNICKVASAKGVERIVFTSSVACYGNAPAGTGEAGDISPFNEYGRTKFMAEEVLRAWQSEVPERRSLAIIRPTVVFGERNRGNVYNLLRQIAMRRFVMVGNGRNVKSMAYVGNLVAFVRMVIPSESGNVLVNYVDGPPMDMNTLVCTVRQELGRPASVGIRLPVWLGILVGWMADTMAAISGSKLSISSVRVRKFVSDSYFSSAAAEMGFVPPYSMVEALRRTIRSEFMDKNQRGPVFYSE